MRVYVCVCVCRTQQYNPTLDRRQFEGEIRRLSRVPEALHELGRMSVLPHETIERISSNTGHTSDDAAAEPAGAPHAKYGTSRHMCLGTGTDTSTRSGVHTCLA